MCLTAMTIISVETALLKNGEQTQGIAHFLGHERVERKRVGDHARRRVALAFREDPRLGPPHLRKRICQDIRSISAQGQERRYIRDHAWRVAKLRSATTPSSGDKHHDLASSCSCTAEGRSGGVNAPCNPGRADLLARAVNARRCKHHVGRSSRAPDPPIVA